MLLQSSTFFLGWWYWVVDHLQAARDLLYGERRVPCRKFSPLCPPCRPAFFLSSRGQYLTFFSYRHIPFVSFVDTWCRLSFEDAPSYFFTRGCSSSLLSQWWTTAPFFLFPRSGVPVCAGAVRRDKEPPSLIGSVSYRLGRYRPKLRSFFLLFRA